MKECKISSVSTSYRKVYTKFPWQVLKLTLHCNCSHSSWPLCGWNKADPSQSPHQGISYMGSKLLIHIQESACTIESLQYSHATKMFWEAQISFSICKQTSIESRIQSWVSNGLFKCIVEDIQHIVNSSAMHQRKFIVEFSSLKITYVFKDVCKGICVFFKWSVACCWRHASFPSIPLSHLWTSYINQRQP